MWISADPAMGDYIPSAPVDEEARKRNGNLPGMGGVYNYVNMHVYHYAGNNPIRYTDPTGKYISSFIAGLGYLGLIVGSFVAVIGIVAFVLIKFPALREWLNYLEEKKKKIDESGIGVGREPMPGETDPNLPHEPATPDDKDREPSFEFHWKKKL
jgi:hypothetical protein